VKGFVLAPVLAVTVLLAGCYSGSRPRRIGEGAPDFAVQDSDRNVALNQFRGQVLVLNFWATWCAPCVEELPSLMNMQARLKGNGVMVLAISIDVDGDAYHRFLKQHEVSLLTVRDPDQKVSRVYGTTGWPETFIIDRQGVLRRKFVGPVDWTGPEVVQFLSKL
jgi:cytochrome c biogenesis protein CcmG, thiol:disulfide interchange protein DsbE